MTLNSDYFQMLRRQPKDKNAKSKHAPQKCQIKDCGLAGTYRAPSQLKGKKWQYFCKRHIQSYNQAYNFFANMSEEEIADFKKSATTGHRPTWRLGQRGPHSGKHGFDNKSVTDYFRLFQEDMERARPRKPKKLSWQIKALEALGLNPDATPEQIKTRFKELVKRYHPDLNGGRRKYEHRLKIVIKSYNELKKSFYL